MVSGEIYRTDTGLAVTARATGVGAATITGPDRELPNLLRQAAEAIYAETQPFRYATYRMNTRGPTDNQAREIFARLAASDSAEERFWAYAGLHGTDQLRDWRLSRAEALAAIALKPDSAIGYANLSVPEMTLGHDEALVAAGQRIAALAPADTTAAGRAFMRNSYSQYRARTAVASADYPAAIAAWTDALRSARSDVRNIARLNLPLVYALVHDRSRSDAALQDLPHVPGDGVIRSIAATALGDWPLAIRSAESVRASYRAAGYSPLATEQYLYAFVHPWVAYSYAQLGQFARAHAEVDHAPSTIITALMCAALLRR